MHTLQIDGLRHPLRVTRFTGHEAISQAFQLEIAVTCDGHDLGPGSLVGRSAALAIEEGGEPRWVHGIVSRFSHGDAAEYQVTLVPAMWRLRLRTDSRIFQGMTVPDIVADVLDRAGFMRTGPRDPDRRGRPRTSGYQMALDQVYRARDYCVQYRESDWDFINRLLEEEGLHCFFEHDESSHVLVITDATTGHEALDGDAIPFRPSSGALSAGEHVSRFRFAEEVRPARVVVSDYSFERPMLPLSASAEAGDDVALEVFEHPGDYDLPQTGSALAQVRLEELQASRWTGQGDSNSIRLAPGRTFSLADHPTAELNRAYLITRVEHRGEGDRYACRFEVIPSDVPFRPPRKTPRPIIHGLQTAIVVGPPGEEIHTDPHGRVKVRFHWDRSGIDDDRCSCWIRVAQASAGGAFGALFLPRVGHEVVVHFLEGDPDRPLVTGSVYHGANVPPYPLPAEKSKSALKTATYPGGGGSNELRFEDRKGNEEVYLHAQRDLAVEAEHNKTEHIGNDETTHVGANRTVHVIGLDTEEVLLTQTVTIGAAQVVTVGGFMSVNVGAAKNELVGAASLETVVGKKWTNVGFSYSAYARTGVTVRSGRNASFMAVGRLSEEAGKDLTMTAGHNLSAIANGGVDIESTGGMIAIQAPKGTVGVQAQRGISITVTGDEVESHSVYAAKGFSLMCGGARILVDEHGNIVIDGKDVTVTSEGTVKVKGKAIQVKGGSIDLN